MTLVFWRVILLLAGSFCDVQGDALRQSEVEENFLAKITSVLEIEEAHFLFGFNHTSSRVLCNVCK